MNLLREKISIMIREKRNSQHLTQEELAEKVNLSTGMIGQIERGETMPSVESLETIIKELGIDPREPLIKSARVDGERFCHSRKC